MKVAILVEDLEAVPENLQALASQYKLEIVNHHSDLFGYLTYHDGSLSFDFIEDKFDKTKQLKMSFDFVKKWQYHKKMNYILKKEPLAKALGLHQRKNGAAIKILDATCGVGDDSLLMLAFGAEVIAFERSPILGELIKDALLRAQNGPDLNLQKILKERFIFNQADSCSFDGKIDVIYLDPMYPENKKSALPKKEMQILRSLLGANESEGLALFHWALGSANKRVVVKRSLSADPIFPHPNIIFEGKSTRYDVYLIAGRILPVQPHTPLPT